MKKVRSVWYEEDRTKLGYGATGLVIELEDGTMMVHQTTDPIMPFEKVQTTDE